MLSDDEQRALEALERCYALEGREPRRTGRARGRSARRSSRPPGFRTVLVLSSVSVALFVAGVPVAALALVLATAIGWSFWRLCSRRTDDDRLTAPPSSSGGQGQNGSGRRPGESIRQYLRWLADAE